MGEPPVPALDAGGVLPAVDLPRSPVGDRHRSPGPPPGARDLPPSIYYHELYKTVNTLLDQYTYRLASFLNDEGFPPSVFVPPRDGYGSIEVLQKNPVAFFSHRHAALLAGGLGTFGVNNTLLTPPEYGPRVRFGSVFTAADLPPDPLLAGDLCTRCMLCVRACPPVSALNEEDYPEASPTRRPARETAPTSPAATSPPPAASASRSARWGKTGGISAATPPLQATRIRATGAPWNTCGNTAGCKPAKKGLFSSHSAHQLVH